MLEAKAKDHGHRRKCSQKNFFSGDLQKKKILKKILRVLQLGSRGFYVQAYADDVAVLFTGAVMLWITSVCSVVRNNQSVN